MTKEQFVEALALTESNNNIYSFGDDGRALGRFQVHPDWVWWWSHRSGIVPRLGETWDSWITRLVENFYDVFIQLLTPVQIAMYFHLGHKSMESDEDWDKDYAQRFNRHSIPAMSA